MSISKIRGSVDPGKQGMIVFYTDEKSDWEPIPVIGKEYDNKAVSEFFKMIRNSARDIHFALEDVNADPSWAAKTNWSLGGCKEMIKQSLIENGIPFTMVHPKVWQKEMWQGVKPIYKPLTAAQKRQGRKNGSVDTKATSTIAALRLIPDVNFKVTSKRGKSKNYNDNLIDAYLMAEYCKRKF